MDQAIRDVEKLLDQKAELPKFKAGDTVFSSSKGL